MIVKGPFTNIWGNTKIHSTVEIGAYTEIGDGVVIEEGVKIGAMCFIPPGVTIRKGAWIGPHVTFTNDKYPPSDTLYETVVEAGAVIGAAAIILPGIIIGGASRVGTGSVVTRHVEPGTVVYGNPAKTPGEALKNWTEMGAMNVVGM